MSGVLNLQMPGDMPVLIEATIEKLMTEYGVETPIRPVQFSYPARLAGLLLLPRQIEGDLGTAIGSAFAGQWGTAGSFSWSPELTGAVNYALQARLPGLSYFAPTLTFWLDAEEQPICDTVTWFVEPTDVGRTVMPILGRLLAESKERLSFFRSVDWFLAQLARVPRKQRFIRRFARLGFHGDDTIERIGESQELVRRLLSTSNALGGRDVQREPVS